MTEIIYDDVLDLRPLVRTILRGWRILTILTIIPTILALFFLYQGAAVYQADAYLLVTRTNTKLSLAEEFPTISEPVDSRSRIASITTIAESESISLQVYDQIKDLPGAENIQQQNFGGRLKVASNGDVLILTAASKDPILAAEIANTWAEVTMRTLNMAYSGQQPLTSIQQQVQVARQEYEKSQKQVEDFIKTNDSEILATHLAESNAIYNAISSKRTNSIKLLTDRINNLDILIIQGESLKQQFQDQSNSNAGALGDSLALMMARASTLGVDHENMTLNLSDLSTLQSTSASLFADINGLVQVAKSEKQAAETELSRLNQEIREDLNGEELKEIVAYIRTVRSQLEELQSRQANLISERDLAREAYQAMLKKETEVRNTVQTSNIITLAGAAVAPNRVSHRSAYVTALLVGAIGGLIGLFWVFRDNIRKFINPPPIDATRQPR